MSNITFLHIATVTPDWSPYDDKSGFPPVIYHRPIAISSLTINHNSYTVEDIDSLYIADLAEEKRQLADFFELFTRHGTDTIVTFNGEAFVLPVLLCGALRYGLTPLFLGPSACIHTDLVAVLSEFTASKSFVSLSDYAVLIGLNKRPFVDVTKLFQAGEVLKIAGRLDVDVMLIAALWFRLQLCKQHASVGLYRSATKALLRACYNRSEAVRGYMDKDDVMRHLQVG